MTISYSTKVTGMLTQPVVDTFANVVVLVYWQVNATDGTLSSSVAGAASLGPPDAADFVAYQDLTEAHVLTWFNDPCSPDVKAYLENQITSQVSAPVSLPLPW